MSGPRRPKCAYCGGPMPPPALTGRPRSFCSAWCRQASEQDADKRARAERERQEQQRAAREQEVAEAARLRQKEREYQAALAEGGAVAADARWARAFDETLARTGWGLCQWAEEIGGEFARVCFRRQAHEWDVYCGPHDRQLDLENARRQRDRAANRKGQD